MDEVVLTEEDLTRIIKNVIESAHESIISVMMDKFENEGSDSAIQYLNYLQIMCQKGDYGNNFDEFIKNIVKDCFEQYRTANG